MKTVAVITSVGGTITSEPEEIVQRTNMKSSGTRCGTQEQFRCKIRTLTLKMKKSKTKAKKVFVIELKHEGEYFVFILRNDSYAAPQPVLPLEKIKLYPMIR